MAQTPYRKRSRLVSAAMGLAYQNGFGATSLADIAREARFLWQRLLLLQDQGRDWRGDRQLRLAELSAQRQRWNYRSSCVSVS